MAAVASRYVVRPMTLADIPQVTEIERESFPTTWPQSSYRRELQSNNMARYLVIGETGAGAPGAFGDAAEPERRLGAGQVLRGMRRLLGRQTVGAAPAPAAAPNQLSAFLGLWFMLEECHVVTVAVRQARRRQGLGELLVITSVEMALKKAQDVLTLECRVSNTAAQALYEKYRFKTVGVRKRYYTDNNEDALIMTTPRIDTPDYRATFEHLRAAHQEHWGRAQIEHPEL